MNNERLNKIWLPLITILLLLNIFLGLKKPVVEAQSIRQYEYVEPEQVKNMAKKGWRVITVWNNYVIMEK